MLSGGNWDTVSESAKNLVRHMLHINPTKRCTAQQVRTLNHRIETVQKPDFLVLSMILA